MDEIDLFMSACPEIYPAELLETYEIMECLNRQELSETLLAREKQSGRKAVVKCYEKEHYLFKSSEPEQMRRLCFPGIPAYIGEYADDKMRCVLREYMEGESLASYAGKMTKQQICRTGGELCGILHYLHSQKPPVIHRDIKPQNVIIQKDGRVALIDFGISRCYKEEQEQDTVYSGTQWFAPPEQYGFAQTDCRSDIYSLGMLLTWLYTGNAAALKHPAGNFEKVLAKATAFAPEKRFRSAKAFAEKLERSLASGRKQRRIGFGVAALTGITVFLVFLWKQPAGKDALTGRITGVCGDEAAYELNFNTDTITITGSGRTYHYYYEGAWEGIYDDSNYRNERPPWYAYRDEFCKVIIMPGITELGADNFTNCYGITQADLGEVKVIGADCFNHCNLSEITLPGSLEKVGAWAFGYNTELESIEFPESVKEIGNAALGGCTALKKVIFYGDTQIATLEKNPQSILANDAGEDASEEAVFYCPPVGGPLVHAKEFEIPYVIAAE